MPSKKKKKCGRGGKRISSLKIILESFLFSSHFPKKKIKNTAAKHLLKPFPPKKKIKKPTNNNKKFYLNQPKVTWDFNSFMSVTLHT